MDKRIILAPVSQKSNNNYISQMENAKKALPVLWSGEINGKDAIGDMFGFVHHEDDQVEVSVVQFVLPGSVISTLWINDPKYSNSAEGKNTLVISPRFITMSWKDYKSLAGYKQNLVLNTNKRLYWPYQYSIA